LDIETVISAIKRRNVLLYRFCERVQKLEKTSKPEKRSKLETERTEFKQKAQQISNTMHPEIRKTMKSIDKMSSRILNDYITLNKSLAYKKKKSLMA
jgi:small-conductance mechanosensitive channel